MRPESNSLSFRTILALALLLLGVNAQASLGRGPRIGPHYIGTGHTQARLSFEARIELPRPSTSTPAPANAILESRINTQLSYLIGPFHQTQMASALGDQELKILSVGRDSARRVFDIKYAYSGTILLNNQYLESQGYEVLLPVRLDGFYARQRPAGKSLCTDGEDTGEAYFFYHWNPLASGCNMVESKDFQRVLGSFKRIANTTRTYPEYERLLDESGTMDIRVFFGKAEYGQQFKDPRLETDKDWGAHDFTVFTRFLVSRGYIMNAWSAGQIRSIAPDGEMPWVEEYTRTVNGRTLKVTVFFGETGLLYSSAAFHRFWEDGLENAAVVIYSGHAGIGKNLHLGKIEKARGRKIELPKDNYQLLVLNACVSYSYYPRLYFDRKKTEASPTGTKNLDILTNGAESLFGSTAIYAQAVVLMLDDWASGTRTWSYQELAAQGRTDFLYGIMGDEDNPTAP